MKVDFLKKNLESCFVLATSLRSLLSKYGGFRISFLKMWRVWCNFSKNKSFFLKIPFCTVFSFLSPQCRISFLEKCSDFGTFFCPKAMFCTLCIGNFFLHVSPKEDLPKFHCSKVYKENFAQIFFCFEVFCF